MPPAEAPLRILFTAFEQSGDEHAALAIEALRDGAPEVEVLAWGGPRMAQAGATLVRETVSTAAMGLPGAAKVREHLALTRDFARWIDREGIDLHVPVDSPAANNPLCAHSRRKGVPIVRLVAPQHWAWASWRVRRLRRWGDELLCVLPFEPDWFAARGVRARFVGHPLFATRLDGQELDRRVAALGLPEGSPRLGLFPGSRMGEIEANWPVMLQTLKALRRRWPDLVAAAAAASPRVKAQLQAPPDAPLTIVDNAADEVARWCDVAVAVSGTVTLRIARQRRPMVALYAMPRLKGWVARRLIVKTPWIALPNVVAGQAVVPELFPCPLGPRGGAALTPVVERLLEDDAQRAAQRKALDRLCAVFEAVDPRRRISEALLEALGCAQPAEREADSGAGSPSSALSAR